MGNVYFVVRHDSLNKTDDVSSLNGRAMAHAVSHRFLTEEARVQYQFSACGIYVKGKAIAVQTWTGPESSRRLRVSECPNSRHMKVARLSALRTGRLYPPGRYSWYSFLLEAEMTAWPKCGWKD